MKTAIPHTNFYITHEAQAAISALVMGAALGVVLVAELVAHLEIRNRGRECGLPARLVSLQTNAIHLTPKVRL